MPRKVCQFFICLKLDRSLMTDWSEELRKPWKDCLCLCFSVCLSVNTLQFTIFNTATLFFENMVFMAMGKKVFFRFPKFSFLTFSWPFFRFFSFLSSYWSQDTPHLTYKQNVWHVGSLRHTCTVKPLFFAGVYFRGRPPYKIQRGPMFAVRAFFLL